jgi:hypothetical protein
MMTYLVLGLLYANLLEWIFHKHVLHNFGKRKDSKFHFHMEHHAVSANHGMRDSPSLHEAFYLFLLSIAHSWLLYFAIWFYIGAVSGGILYWMVHTKAHTDPDWMLDWVFWHYAHHAWYTNANWCVTYPLFDIILGTYKYD